MLGLLFPRKCILCRGLLTRGEIDLCGSCRENTEKWQPGKRKVQFLDSFAAVWYYEGYVRSSILRFKFYRGRHLSQGFGRRVALRITESELADCQVLTWVPISFMRRLRRGYDQGELLARAVGAELGISPVKTLKKIRNNKQQSSIRNDAQRRANVLGAYRVTDAEAIRGKRVLLLDDVFTTGATAGECARMLLTAGAKEVHCVAIAAARK